MKKFAFATLALAILPSVALAQAAGSWLIQGGVTQITPHVSSGTLSAPAPPSTTVDVSGDTKPTLQITYIIDDHFALAVPLGTGFKHKLYGNGAIQGVGQIGTVTALPASLFFQYRFGEAQARFRPYAMFGMNYVMFKDAAGSAALNGLNPINPSTGTGLKIDSQFTVSTGLGMSYKLDDKWFVDLSYARTMLKTTTTLSTGQSIHTTLDPSMVSLGVGMKF
jgi:outer membrane protein